MGKTAEYWGKRTRKDRGTLLPSPFTIVQQIHEGDVTVVDETAESLEDPKRMTPQKLASLYGLRPSHSVSNELPHAVRPPGT